MINHVLPLRNVIQEYAWGSHTALADLLGQPSPSDRPQAELWMGAHHKASSLVLVDGQWQGLSGLIERAPVDILGDAVAREFSNRLPFLFKVLAAARPLSIQAHPNERHAEEGFEREDALGLRLDAPNRNYRDRHHKPEILCSLTPFWALGGFRSPQSILSQWRVLGLRGIEQAAVCLKHPDETEGLKGFFQSLMTLPSERATDVISQALRFARAHQEEDPAYSWMLRLAEDHPGDIGILSPVFLNLIHLEPGEAICLPAGQLHAYLEGVGVELMANSDNVLRGGLTSKHLDVQELMSILDFRASVPEILVPDILPSGEKVYQTIVREFVLSVLSVSDRHPYVCGDHQNVSILLCVTGHARLRGEDGQSLEMPKGSSFLLPASIRNFEIEGHAEIYQATVPSASGGLGCAPRPS